MAQSERRFYLGLRLKLLGTLVLFTLIPLLILGTLITQQARQIVTESVVYLQQMRASVLTQAVETSVDQYIHSVLRKVSRDKRLYSMTEVQQLEKLAEIQIVDPSFEDPFWSTQLRTAEGRNLHDPDEPDTEILLWRNLIKHYQEQEEEFYYEEFIEDPTMPIQVHYEKCRYITAVTPEFADSTIYLTGIVRLDTDFMLYGEITKLNIDDMPIFVLDNVGQPVFVRNVPENMEFDTLIQKDRQNNATWLEYAVNNRMYYIFKSDLDLLQNESNLAWTLFVAMPRHEITSRVEVSKRTIVIAGLISLLVLTATGSVLTARVIRPIHRIIDGTNQIRKGNLDKRIAVDTHDEIQQMAQGFNQMAEAIQENVLKYKQQAAELDRRVTEMTILHDLGKSMNSTLDLDRLLNTVILCTVTGLKFDRAVLLLLADDGVWLTPYATIKSLEPHISEIKIDIENDPGVFASCAQTGDEILIKETDDDNRVTPLDRSIMIDSPGFFLTPLIAKGQVIGVLAVDNPTTGDELTRDKLSTLNAFANSAALAIHNALLYDRLAENERVEQELKIGNQIQTGLLPKDFPKISGLSVVGKMIPAREIGGDYFDFINQNGHGLGVAIGDVAGKGVPAGLIMAMARSIVRSVALSSHSTKQILSELNRLIKQDMEEFRFMTMIYLNWHPEQHKLLYSSAGHERILIYRAKKKDCDIIRTPGVAIGLADNLDEFLYENEIPLEIDDVVVLYTDGVTEATNMEGQRFGLDRIVETINNLGHLSAVEMMNGMISRLKQFMGNAAQYDDITIVILKKTADQTGEMTQTAEQKNLLLADPALSAPSQN